MILSEFLIRNANEKDLDRVAYIESVCFPSSEAASKCSIAERLDVYSRGFFVGELEGQIIGFVNGASTDDESIRDEFFESMDLHDEKGKNLVIFGLDVHPDHQGKGYAKNLMNHFIDFAKSEGKKKVLLTCKSHLVHYYERFGYVNLGVSASVHGGAKWYDMELAVG